jgi:hypothetical protein
MFTQPPNGPRITRAATAKKSTSPETYLRTRFTAAYSRASGVGLMRWLGGRDKMRYQAKDNPSLT